MKKIVRVAVCLAAILCFSPGPAEAGCEAKQVVPVGHTIGINIECDGVMVVGAVKIETGDGSISPAREAGIRPGDVITGINSCRICSAADLKAALASADSGELQVKVVRGGAEKCFTMKPHVGEGGKLELGLWLRDGMTGIGTMTFFDPESGTFGALGHPVSDMDTGVTVPVRKGTIMKSTVSGLVRGAEGSPGQLQGSIDGGNIQGSITSNRESGIFGTLTGGAEPEGQLVPVASEDEIETGAASILCNVSGDDVEEYAIEITRIYTGSKGSCRDMMLRVTDEALLEKTGGILQGMSGSPIIQNGKLVGAVTHVLINDPTMGYGIAIGNMMDDAA